MIKIILEGQDAIDYIHGSNRKVNGMRSKIRDLTEEIDSLKAEEAVTVSVKVPNIPEMGPSQVSRSLFDISDDLDDDINRRFGKNKNPFIRHAAPKVAEHMPSSPDSDSAPWQKWEEALIHSAVGRETSTSSVDYILGRGTRTKQALTSKIRRMGYRVKNGYIKHKVK